MTRRSWWLATALSTGLALFQLRLALIALGPGFQRSIDVALGVAHGTPHWRIYQNRIIGPYLAEGLSGVMSFTSAHVLVCVVALSAAGVLAWRIGSRASDWRGGLAALAVMHGGFSLLLHFRWLFVWDFIDVAVFMLFVDFVITGKSWKWFVPLGMLGVLNHEIALFVTGWLVVDPIARWLLGKLGKAPAAPFDRITCLVGALATVINLQIVERVRDALLDVAIGRLLFEDAPASADSSFQLQLFDNLSIIKKVLTHWDWSFAFLLPLMLVATIALIVWLVRQDPVRWLGLGLVFLAMIASLLVFGVLPETRIFVVLLPLYVLATVAMPRVDT